MQTNQRCLHNKTKRDKSKPHWLRVLGKLMHSDCHKEPQYYPSLNGINSLLLLFSWMPSSSFSLENLLVFTNFIFHLGYLAHDILNIIYKIILSNTICHTNHKILNPAYLPSISPLITRYLRKDSKYSISWVNGNRLLF